MSLQQSRQIVEQLRRLGSLQPDDARLQSALAQTRRALAVSTTQRPAPSDVQPLAVPIARSAPWRALAAATLAVAASLALIVTLALQFMPAKPALADVARQIKGLHAVGFTTTIVNADGSRSESRSMVLDHRLRRTEHDDGRIEFFDRQRGEWLLLLPEQQRAVRRFDRVYAGDLFDMIERLNDLDVVETRSETDPSGRKLTFYQLNSRAHSRLWIDTASRLPVRFESVVQVPGGERRTIMHDFTFGNDFSPELFDLATPPGYAETVDAPPLQPLANPEMQSPVIVPGVSIGPAQFGMPPAEVIALLGPPEKVDQQIYSYPSRGYDLFIAPSRLGLHGIFCRTQAAWPYRIRDFSGQTDRGIRMGASEQDILEAYGEPTERHHSGSTVTLLYRPVSQSSLVFHLQDDRLIQLEHTASSLPHHGSDRPNSGLN